MCPPASPRRQFFAGTPCPSCGVLDTVCRQQADDGRIWLECVACGYRQDISNGYSPRGEESHDEETGSTEDLVHWRPPAHREKPG